METTIMGYSLGFNLVAGSGSQPSFMHSISFLLPTMQAGFVRLPSNSLNSMLQALARRGHAGLGH